MFSTLMVGDGFQGLSVLVAFFESLVTIRPPLTSGVELCLHMVLGGDVGYWRCYDVFLMIFW